ncbi:MAG TPA: hypothetical protein VGX51_00735 [Solirubrobacteraceae bacterium]|nr:hypothetical protein [Solirubrobacteraceae bacterium]
MPDAATTAVFPRAQIGAGMYESFYLRVTAPNEPLGGWIRYTVHKRPGEQPRGSVWFTLFDARAGAPLMHKHTSDAPRVPAGGWIAIGDSGGGQAPTGHDVEGGSISPGQASGRCGPASWSLRWESDEAELRHLGAPFLYRAPLPRTKLTSPAPCARFNGAIELAGRPAITVDGWRGMVGHNWGAEHAERWIWLHGVDFDGAAEAWLDVALGRVRVGRVLTPWVANGAICLDGTRHRVGGLTARGAHVREDAHGCALELVGERGLALQAQAIVPDHTAAGWRYSDPDGSEHDVVNCSIAELELDVKLPGKGAARVLHSAHGGAYELGMREHDHGVALAPFADG